MSQSPELSAQQSNVMVVLRDRLASEIMERSVAEAAAREAQATLQEVRAEVQAFLKALDADDTAAVKSHQAVLDGWANPTEQEATP